MPLLVLLYYLLPVYLKRLVERARRLYVYYIVLFVFFFILENALFEFSTSFQHIHFFCALYTNLGFFPILSHLYRF